MQDNDLYSNSICSFLKNYHKKHNDHKEDKEPLSFGMIYSLS